MGYLLWRNDLTPTITIASFFDTQIPIGEEGHPETHAAITSCACASSACGTAVIESPTGTAQLQCPSGLPCAFNCTVDMVRDPKYITETVTVITTVVKPVISTITLTTTEWSTIYAGSCTAYTTLYHNAKEITTTHTVSITEEISSTTYITEYQKVIATKTILCQPSGTGVVNPPIIDSSVVEPSLVKPPVGKLPIDEDEDDFIKGRPNPGIPSPTAWQIVDQFTWNNPTETPTVRRTRVPVPPTALPPKPTVRPKPRAECVAKNLETYEALWTNWNSRPHLDFRHTAQHAEFGWALGLRKVDLQVTAIWHWAYSQTTRQAAAIWNFSKKDGFYGGYIDNLRGPKPMYLASFSVEPWIASGVKFGLGGVLRISLTTHRPNGEKEEIRYITKLGNADLNVYTVNLRDTPIEVDAPITIGVVYMPPDGEAEFVYMYLTNLIFCYENLELLPAVP
ncbi:hypothetical protein TWF281_004843 [Arthrobotrys megalospora]